MKKEYMSYTKKKSSNIITILMLLILATTSIIFINPLTAEASSTFKVSGSIDGGKKDCFSIWKDLIPGEEAVLNVKVTSSDKSNPIKYQWYDEKDNAIKGATKSKFRVKKNKVGFFNYYCKVTQGKKVKTTDLYSVQYFNAVAEKATQPKTKYVKVPPAGKFMFSINIRAIKGANVKVKWILVEYLMDGNEKVTPLPEQTGADCVIDCSKFSKAKDIEDIVLGYSLSINGGESVYSNHYNIELRTDAKKSHTHKKAAPVRENVVAATSNKFGSCLESTYCKQCGKLLSQKKVKIKKKQSLSLKTTSKTLKKSDLNKKSLSFTLKKDVKDKAKVTFKKISGNKKITVNSSGKVTVKKGLKKGSYQLKVQLKAAETKNYRGTTITKVITINVK